MARDDSDFSGARARTTGISRSVLWPGRRRSRASGRPSAPTARLLVGRRRAGARREDVVEHLDLDLRVLLEVGVPAGRLVGAALGGDDHVVVAGGAVDQRRRALLAALAALRGEQEDRGALLPVVTDLAAGLAVAADVLVAEEMGCVLSGHARGLPATAAEYRGRAVMTRHDAVIVGGGHNGLVAAAYLARAGRSVLVLERREHAGGAAVSERPWPGVDARLSRYSYLVSLLPRGDRARPRPRASSCAGARSPPTRRAPDGGGLLVRTGRRAARRLARLLRDDRARRPARVPDAHAAAARARRAARRGGRGRRLGGAVRAPAGRGGRGGLRRRRRARRSRSRTG